MAKKIHEFHQLIRMSFESNAAFARALGVDRRTLDKVTSGHKMPSLVELEAYSIHLNTSIEDLARIFLRHKFPNGQQHEREVS